MTRGELTGWSIPVKRGDRIAGVIVYLADRRNCVVLAGFIF